MLRNVTKHGRMQKMRLDGDILYLKKSFDKKKNRTYMAIVHGYRDATGKSRTELIQSIGYLDDLQKQYDDPIAHFSAVAKSMDEERKANKSITITLDLKEPINPEIIYRKNYGCVLFSKIYHELGIDHFLKNAMYFP